MRILYVAVGMPVPGSHGGSVHAASLCRGLAALGHEVHMVAQAGVGDPADLDGVLLHGVSAPVFPQLEWMRRPNVFRVAAQVRPQVVVERFYTFGGCGAAAADRMSLPLVLEINSPARPYPGSWRDRLDALSLLRPVDRWRRWQLERADAYYGSSPVLVAEELRDRFTVIPNGGVDCDRIVPGGPVPDTGTIELVHVSSFRAWHGAEDLVAAAAAAVDRGADVRLTCVGSGPREAAARAVAARASAGDRVRFLGRVPHARMAAILAASHVGVAPFNPGRHVALRLGWYWSPIKVYEYLAAGLPVVTADIDALRAELPEEVARFYPAGDVSALADCILALAGDRGGIRSSGEAARVLAETRFTWASHAHALSGLLEATVTP